MSTPAEKSLHYTLHIAIVRSSCVLLLDHVTFDVVLKVDDVTSLDVSSDSRVREQSVKIIHYGNRDLLVL